MNAREIAKLRLRTARVDVRLARELNRAEQGALDDAVALYGRFLDMPATLHV